MLGVSSNLNVPQAWCAFAGVQHTCQLRTRNAPGPGVSRSKASKPANCKLQCIAEALLRAFYPSEDAAFWKLSVPCGS
jgi:hypothetical protein